jgi:hypothetical protein
MQKKTFFFSPPHILEFPFGASRRENFFFVKISHRNEAQLHSTTKETDQRHRTLMVKLFIESGGKKHE